MTTGRQHLLRCSARFIGATQFHLAYLADSVLGTSQGLRTQPGVIGILLEICGIFKNKHASRHPDDVRISAANAGRYISKEH